MGELAVAHAARPVCWFCQDYLALQPAIHPALDAALSRHSGANLWVTGHSLGAAMACLLAADLASAGHDIGTVYTFGQPRVGDAAFASYYGSQVADEYYRVVHYHDSALAPAPSAVRECRSNAPLPLATVVPHVPPELLGFRHVPTVSISMSRCVLLKGDLTRGLAAFSAVFAGGVVQHRDWRQLQGVRRHRRGWLVQRQRHVAHLRVGPLEVPWQCVRAPRRRWLFSVLTILVVALLQLHWAVVVVRRGLWCAACLLLPSW